MRKFLLIFLLIASVSSAHLGEEVEEHDLSVECIDEACFIEDSFSYSLLVAEAGLAVLIIIAMLSIAFRKKLNARRKKSIFVLMVAVIVAVTSYLVAVTIYANYFSASGGPVHWHADYEIWICGERMQLKESEGLENKVGTPVFHHHNDNRIHVEGVVYDMQDIALGKFFEAIGGHLDSESLRINLVDGSVREVRNGDLCYGDPGTLRVFVNGDQISGFENFILAPYSTVPPGDFINITFGD